jgi:hypothetical protein
VAIIKSRRINNGSPVWITIDEIQLQDLRDRVSRSVECKSNPMFKSLLSEVQYEVTVPCIADRVVMTAAVSVLAPIFEVDMPGWGAMVVALQDISERR